MKNLKVLVERIVTTTFYHELRIDVDDDFVEFTDDEIDIILNNDTYCLDNYSAVDEVQFDANWQVDSLTNSECRPIGSMRVINSETNEQIQYCSISDLD